MNDFDVLGCKEIQFPLITDIESTDHLPFFIIDVLFDPASRVNSTT